MLERCCSCKQELPTDLFGSRGQLKACRACRSQYQRRWNAKNRAAIAAIGKRFRERHPGEIYEYSKGYCARPDVKARKRDTRRRSRLKRRFGITPEQYDAMLASQGGGCAICGRKPGGRRLAIDHDHTAGGVRALLCHPCNSAIGLFGESTEWLAKAIDYLRRHKEKGVSVNGCGMGISDT